ncbi:MAG: hypothetical protein WCE44_06500 [Candidatus Velthaea sp.]|jgi:lipopolysaccharide export system protein LptA
MSGWPWRRLAVIAGCLVAAWIVWGIVRAGNDVPPPAANPVTQLGPGHAEGRRINAPAWTLDYDTIVETPDGTSATLTHVRNGEIFRNGKPYVSVQADTIVVNTVSNDFSASGHVVLIENDNKHQRRFRSQQAAYSGGLEILTLPVSARIESDGLKVQVERATVNLRTGAMTLGRIDAVG